MHHLKRFVFSLLAIALAVGCTTTKKRNETSKVGMLYHDITSKYNRNFNANILIDETIAGIDQAYQDDYSEILPLYPLNLNEDPTKLYEPMDQAIEKASVAISIHRPSHWTDDNYLIIGRAQYLKQDYESAEATFRYIIKHYDPKNIIRQSQQKSSNRDKKLSEREKAIERKAAEKIRNEKIKERKKAVAKSKKAKKSKKLAEKKRKAKIKARRDQIKERERLAKKGKSTPSGKEAGPDVAAKPTKESSPKKRKGTFDDNPPLPKIKGDPNNYFLKHKPALQEAKLWLAKTLIERDRYGEAENILRSLDSDAKTFDEIRDELYVVQAYSSLDRGQTAAAADPLRKAIDRAKRGEQKARYAFILAQVLEKTNQHTQALAAYDHVVKLRPAYEMHFNALLNKTKMQWNSSSMDDKKFESTVNRMIKDDKNSEYQDQLYFALAEKDLKNGNFEGAIANLSQSVSKSAGNQVQRAESYYKMANLFFQAEEFARAKYYFDTTLTALQPSDPRHEEVTTYIKNLSQIAVHLETIDLQDSLLRVSTLSDKELKKLAAKLKKEAAAAKLAAQAAATKPNNARTATVSQVSQRGSLASTGSTFFAYDDKALKKGLRDFKREWGDVGLVDNWRRSSQNSFNLGSGEGEGDDGSVTLAPISETEIDEIFKGVPKTDEEKKAAEGKIEEALFELGRLFRSELGKNKQSIEALERMIKLNPASEHLLDAYYLLYVSHSELGQTAQAGIYKDKILTDFADSEYAKYINDPSYLRDVVTEEMKVEQYYQNVHGLYNAGKYKDAYTKLKAAPEAIGTKHALLSKFSMMTALCIGRLQGREQYVNALKDLIAKYPNTEEEEKAKEIIRLLGIRFTETNDGIEEIDPDAYFQLGPSDNMHLILVALKEGADGAKQNQARVEISDYNKKYHKLDRLNVATIVLNGDTTIPLFVIRRFAKRDAAMKYYDGVQANINEFIDDPTSFEVFATSQRNYRKIIQLKSIDLYRDFFVKEYLSK